MALLAGADNVGAVMADAVVADIAKEHISNIHATKGTDLFIQSTGRTWRILG
jgi:hypothetical protein